MTSFSKYKVILWDFDGVIMDSMPVRDKGFEIVLSDYPKDQVAMLMQFHRKNGGLSRYVKLRYFFEEIRNEIVTDEAISKLAGAFSQIMRNELVNASLLITESLTFINENYQKFAMHVVSGSDENELKFLCEKLGLTRFFKSVHGSPVPKPELVKHVIAQNNYINDQVLLIGDSVNDYDAAEQSAINFMGYNNTSLRGLGIGYIESLRM